MPASRLQRFRIAVSGLDALAGAQVVGVGEVSVGAAESRWVPVAVQVPPEVAQRAGGGAHPIEFRIEQLAASPDDNRLATQRAVDIRRTALKGAIPP